jgi:hypothetical protein
VFRITPIRSVALAAAAASLALAAPAGAAFDSGHSGATHGPAAAAAAPHQNFSIPEVDDEVLVLREPAHGIIGILIGL